jgi:small subunit ribosomal protein S16
LATKIRLKRIGRRNRPFYRLIVIDSRKKRDGAAIEQVGWYNPISVDNSYEINDERIMHWLSEGAIPSDAVKKIMRQEGLSLRWHLMQQGTDEKEIEKEMKKWEMNRENVLADRQAKKIEKLSKKSESSQVEDTELEPVKAEPVKAEPVKAEAVKAEAVKAEAVKAEAVKAEPVKAEPVKAEPVKAEPVKAEPVKAEVMKAEPVKAPKEKDESEEE